MSLLTALPHEHEVHVWTVELAPGARALRECAACLSGEERERAARFRFEHLQTAFTLSHGLLRILLGRYTGVEPGDVRFAYGPHGKPSLEFPDVPLHFNLSHSGKLASYAFTVGCEIGIDIEVIRPVSEQESIVRRFFSEAECAEWMQLDRALRDEAFFLCWTRKEAFIKTRGEGLSIPLDSFQVSLRPGEPASLIRCQGDDASKWALHSWRPAEGYAGALAAPDRELTLRLSPLLSPDDVLDRVERRGEFAPG